MLPQSGFVAAPRPPPDSGRDERGECCKSEELNAGHPAVQLLEIPSAEQCQHYPHDGDDPHDESQGAHAEHPTWVGRVVLLSEDIM